MSKPTGYSIEVRQLETDKRPLLTDIVLRLNERFQYVKTRNEHGFLDQFEQQMELTCCDIAQGLGGRVAITNDENGKVNFAFYFGC